MKSLPPSNRAPTGGHSQTCLWKMRMKSACEKFLWKMRVDWICRIKRVVNFATSWRKARDTQSNAKVSFRIIKKREIKCFSVYLRASLCVPVCLWMSPCVPVCVLVSPCVSVCVPVCLRLSVYLRLRLSAQVVISIPYGNFAIAKFRKLANFSANFANSQT